MKKVLFPCLSAIVLLISCSKDDPASNTPAADKYQSITTGNKWIYDVTTNPGTPTQSTVPDTVTTTATDTSVTLSGSSRTYRIFKHSNGDISDYYNISGYFENGTFIGSDYYRYQKIDLNGTFLQIEDLYLRDYKPLNSNWSQTLNLNLPGFPFAVPVTVTNTIIEKGSSRTVNGTAYTDVIAIKTDITSSGLPAGTIVTDIKTYYAKKVGMIEADYKVQISAASVDINTKTILKSATIQ